MTPELLDKLDKKEIVFGGCFFAVSSPSHHCHACRQDFGGSYFAEPTFIKELYFYVGGYFGTSHWVYLNTEKFGKTLRYAFSEEHAIAFDRNVLVVIIWLSFP
jgi:hypothetical protein